MSPMTIRRQILLVLKTTHPFAVPQETLFDEVNQRVRPALKSVDLVKHLTWLHLHEMVSYLESEMDPENADARRWHIKEAGLTVLQS